jgi:hypothetical protein
VRCNSVDITPCCAACDGDLALLLTAWPDLPAAMRAGIVAMVNAARSPR